ncbi:MAG TPA: DinB family protein [Puia sp.]|nr:DinB family protein [Puia sp.]
MNNEIEKFADSLKDVLWQDPWYGDSVYSIIGDVDPRLVAKNPGTAHSPLELLYHMCSWAEFVLAQVKKDLAGVEAAEKNNWRDMSSCTWEDGVDLLKKTHEQILASLEEKSDSLLEEQAINRTFNYRYLLYGLIQHNIYHAGQIAYAGKILQNA